MAVLTQDQLGLMELANRTANGGVIQVANVLSQRNEFLRGAYWQEANAGTRHKVSRVTALPTGNKRQLNDGVAKESSKTQPLWETMQILEGFSDVDVKELELSPNPGAFREQEDRLYAEGMMKTFATDFITGNPATNPLSMRGLQPRLSTLTTGRVVSGGGSSSGSMTSMYIVKWGETGCSFIYPPNTPAGISVRNLGRRVAAGTTANTQLEVDTTKIEMTVGFKVEDLRHIYRVCNLVVTGSSNVPTSTQLITGIGQVSKSGDTSGIRILMNQDAFNYIDIEATGKTNVVHSGNDPFGRPIYTFRGIPIDICDAITSTETTVS